MQGLGTHLLVELHGCSPDLLKNTEVVKEVMVSAAQACKATIVDAMFHAFNPYGVSGVVVIAESHLSIHTWPEHRYAAVDIFTCGEVIKPEEAVEYIAAQFRCKTISVLQVKRGLFPGANGKVAHKPASASRKSAPNVSHVSPELSLVS